MAESQPAATAPAGDSCNPELSNGEEASETMEQERQGGIKRPAEQQLGPDDIDKEYKPEEPGEFCKADDDVIAQRAVFAPVSAMVEDDENDIDDGFNKPTFRLNPPTLIHGQAKSAPTSSDGEEKENENVKPFLRPSALNNHGKDEEGEEKLGNPLADGAHSLPFAMAATAENNSETESEAYKRTKLFLPFTTGESSERDLGFGVFGKFRDSAYRIGFTEQDGRVSDGNSMDKEPDPDQHEGTTHENYFAQFASKKDKELNSSGDSPSSLSSSSGSSFLFGQNMNERVTSPNRQEGELQSVGELVFGQNLSARIKNDGFNETSPEKPKEQTLAENASALEEARERMRRKFEDVENLTGEEDEENVVSSHCKLFVFDNVKRNWLERGRGQIRLNDSRQLATDSAFQSRLVMRTQGSYRLILNTKIWSDMTLEKATTRNLRISAMDAESETIKIFLVTGTPKDIEQLYCAIEYRVQALKHVEEDKRSDVEEGQTGAQDTKDEEDEDEEDAEDDDEDDDEDSEVAKICSRDRSKPTSPKSTEGNSASASPSLHPEES
ncbi:ran-binding protein 3-like [Lytechinus pictus]|uniref:ran-binding protein 3-like n=1 Tax=Lytechinus pictus TaxID=7653 RepID=UPI0030B9EE95